MKKILSFSIALVAFVNIFAATITTNKTSYVIGEAIVVNFTGSTTAKDWMGIFPLGASVATGNYVDWLYTSGTKTSGVLKASGSVTFASGLATASNYTLYLLANDGFTILASCNFAVINTVPPVVQFSANQTTVFPGQTVYFTDQSQNSPTSWVWSFPNGTPATSTLQNPSVSYAANGTYNVTLTATNSFGTSAPLTKTGYITVSGTPANNALQFDGVDDQLFMPLDTLKTWTVQAWVKGNDATWSATNEAIITNGWINISQWEQYPLVIKNGKPGTSAVQSPVALDANWHHLAVTSDGAVEKVYVDGVLKATGAAGTGKPCSPNFIGSYDSDSNGSEYFNGTIDEVAIFNGVLSQTTIQQWMNKPITPSHPNYSRLKLYYTFDDQESQCSDLKKHYLGTLKRQYNSLQNPVGPQYVANTNASFVIPASAMTYLNSYVLPAKHDAFPNKSVQMMKLKVNVQGYQTPLALTELNLNLSACTRLSDISKVHVYSLGKSIASTNKVEIMGTGLTAAGNLTFSGSQALIPGTNYFLVTCDLATGAVIGDSLNVSCVSFKLNATSYMPELLKDINYPTGIEIIDPNPNPQKLKVLSWNIWHGAKGLGLQTGIKRVVDIIRASRADVVTMVETYGAGPAIRDSLGFYYYEPSSGSNLTILSRYPLSTIYPARNNAFNCIGAQVTIPVTNMKVNVFAWWLPYWGGDYTLLRWSPTTTAAAWIAGDNATTVPTLNSNFSKDINFYVKDNTPTIIGGDFNSCSHLDFTAAAGAAGVHNGWVVDFPVSHGMMNKGFTDSYRQANPNNITHIGGTWAAIYNECHDFRFDFLYYKAPAANMTCIKSRTYDDYTDIGVQWPGDHQAVLSTFSISNIANTSNMSSAVSIPGTDPKWSVYPNPSKGVFTLSFADKLNGNGSISVADTSGKTIFIKNFKTFNQSETIDLRNVTNGVYFVKIKTNNNVDVTKRITVMK